VPANALNSLNNNLARLVGAALGGILFGLFGLAGVVLIDVASFLIAAGLVGQISGGAARAPRPANSSPSAASWLGLWREWLDGLRLIGRDRTLATLFAMVAITSVGEGIMSALFVVFVGAVLHAGALELGWLMSAQGAGGLLGGVVVGALGRRFAPARLLGVSAILFGAIDLAIFNYPLYIPGVGLGIALFVLVGVPAVGFTTAENTLFQASVADAYRGRVFGAIGATQGLLMLAGAALAGVAPARAAARREPPEDAVGLLYDATLCIGCKACVGACAQANNLQPDTSWSNGLYQAPVDLNARTKNIIKMYRAGTDQSFMKVQCMHCVDPACASACMLGALKKRELGIVSYDESLCVGCRYCEMACPYNVPKFEWAKLNPRIVKCELCRHRISTGGIPACAEVCPRKAVIYGRRADLLTEAKRRIADGGGKYVPKVYGETDGGGTQVLYLSHVPFESLGLPALGEHGIASRARAVQHAVDKYFIMPGVLYAVLSAVTFRNRKAADWRKPPEEQP